MRRLRRFLTRLFSFASKQRDEERLREEIAEHLALQVADNICSGMNEAEARRQALLKFGAVESMTEEYRAVQRLVFLDSLLQDIRFAFRMLRKSPGFTAVAVLTLALGIGANTAIFSVVNSALLRPLPYKNAGSLLWPTLEFPKTDLHGSFVPHPIYFAWRDQNHVFSGIAATHFVQEFTLTGTGFPERIAGMRVSANFFSVLGVELARGRGFTSEEDRPGGPHAAILTYGLWRSRYAANPKILGRPITLDDKEYSIVGILPSSFKFSTLGMQPQVYLPLAAPADASSAIWSLGVIARLKPGVTLAQAKADLSLIDGHTLPMLPKFFGRYTHQVRLSLLSLHDHLTGGVRTPLLVLMAAVVFILLIACANIANLQLSRGTVRAREFAMRSALGATRFRLARQLLTETMLLSVLGGLAGVIVGFWGLSLLRSFMPSGLLNVLSVRIDAVALAFAIAASVMSGVISALAPMLSLSGANLNDAIHAGRTRVVGLLKNAFPRNLLAVSEVAAALILLVAAGLLLKSFVRLTSISSGFNSHSVLTARISLPADKYATDQQQAAFSTQLLSRISVLPGVRAASLSTSLPNMLSSETRIGVEGRPVPASDDPTASVPLDFVSEAYFRVLEIPILSGRAFDEQDGPNTAKVAIVNREFVQRFFPNGEDPIGKHILIAPGTPDQTPVSIVGVCAAIRRAGPGEKPLPQVFQPLAQSPSSEIAVSLRTASDPRALVSALRSQVLAIDKELPLFDVSTMDNLFAEETRGQRFETGAVGLFAALALLLAGVGIYGVISYLVSQRTHEIGVRVALGAQRADVLRIVIRDGLFIVGTGIAIGIGGALAVTQLLRSLLFQITPTDPATYSAVTLILLTITLLSCYFPARRAMRVDPLVALRYE